MTTVLTFVTIIDTLLEKIHRSKMAKWQETEQIWHRQKSGQEGERPQHFSVLLLFTISSCVSWTSNDHHHHFLFRFQALVCANALFIIRDCCAVYACRGNKSEGFIGLLGKKSRRPVAYRHRNVSFDSRIKEIIDHSTSVRITEQVG